MGKFNVSVEIQTDYYKNLQRSDVSIEGAFREMIDNSTTSFMDHEEILHGLGEKCCVVKIKWDNEKIEVSDNAYGMNLDDFQRAFELSKKATHYSENSRGQFGMGLKYGALALGPKYTVETIEYNSCKKFRGTLDSNELDITKAKTIVAEEFDAMDNLHGTKITIVPQTGYKYNKYMTPKKLDALTTKLSMIYSQDLRKNKLQLWLNDQRIKYNEPIWQNDANGEAVFHHFNNSFMLDGKEYKYSGWLGQLETGSTYNAGFSLMQKGRAIEINYRPKEIFGAPNTYAYQRLFGEIALEGNNWAVSFTKSKIKWEDEGVEDAFIKSLLDTKEVNEIKTFATKYRSGQKSLSVSELKKKTEREQKKKIKELKSAIDYNFDQLKKTNFDTKIEENGYKFELPVIEEVKKEESIDFVLEENNKTYVFTVKDSDEKADYFYKLVQKNGKENEYDLYVNTYYGIFKENSKNSNEKFHSFKIAVRLALAQVASESYGITKEQSQTLINIFTKQCKR